jgi:hypothetical protein
MGMRTTICVGVAGFTFCVGVGTGFLLGLL